MKNLSEVRKQAWQTRRVKYGNKGHASTYSRASATRCLHCSAATNLIIRLLNEGTLSEGQVAKALELDRVSVRMLSDTLLNTHRSNR